jgi:hypothetical protein
MARHSALDRQMNRRCKAVTHELAEILWCVVRVDIADHDRVPLVSRDFLQQVMLSNPV